MIHMGRIFIFPHLPLDFVAVLTGRLCQLANERGVPEGQRAFWGGGAKLEWSPRLEAHPLLLQVQKYI
jgi:hypothetical protein